MTREQKGQELFDRGAVEKTGHRIYRVEGNGGRYTVNLQLGYCSCPDHRKREQVCKHMHACTIFETTAANEGRNFDGERNRAKADSLRGVMPVDKVLAGLNQMGV